MGGEVMYKGTLKNFYKEKDSLTASYLAPNREWVPDRTPGTS